MDLAELKRRSDASRTLTVEVGGRKFTLRLPPRPVVQMTIEATPNIGVAVWNLLIESLIGWSGVTIGDLRPDDSDAHEPLPFDRQAVQLLLDERLDITGAITSALTEAIQRRNQEMEAARKN